MTLMSRWIRNTNRKRNYFESQEIKTPRFLWRCRITELNMEKECISYPRALIKGLLWHLHVGSSSNQSWAHLSNSFCPAWSQNPNPVSLHLCRHHVTTLGILNDRKENDKQNQELLNDIAGKRYAKWYRRYRRRYYSWHPRSRPLLRKNLGDKLCVINRELGR